MRGIDELDHYELLEVNRHATIGEVDRAYRISDQTYADGSLALYSVFENADAAAIRERLYEAFRVLSDPDLRAAYDQENPEAAQSPALLGGRAEEQVVMFGDPLPADAAWAPEGPPASHPLDGFDPIEQLGALDEAVEEFDALEDDGHASWTRGTAWDLSSASATARRGGSAAEAGALQHGRSEQHGLGALSNVGRRSKTSQNSGTSILTPEV